jgi:DNA invertase Pin-like site-specific DNA recombinase
MIAAVCARKSADQNGVGDEEKSVARQVERARAYALKKGWAVLSKYVFAGDGISGAEFERRPGLMALMGSLEPRPPFHVVIMSNVDRLGREQIETTYLLKRSWSPALACSTTWMTASVSWTRQRTSSCSP